MKPAQDIISLPIEIKAEIADSKFRLVHMAAQRMRRLSAGQPPLVVSTSIKDTTVALEEAVIGGLPYVIGEEALQAKEEYQKQQEQARIDEELSAKEEEIRKELSVYLSASQEDAEPGEEVEAAESSEEDAEEEPGDEGEEAQPAE
ncbi:MAG: DNA-directed RNA polymerase subunit omega [Nitrospirae bacterium GWC2_57_13]|jgi:DNA-directed RNA polymerase omega subunit|nr:MAG: DNA-directed RNA polymerase subunit omega [Nitrospirae bacterium GWC2_57_13]OGW43209.1 MAG: DNA-directed RNA polymerase subunit omega [Nitrospirae bacterium GWD2_57_8]HAR45549.1 DNA-directed RNA polymerase subunit omega [Nitrospiraceae bacterium]HAS52621.1 DNA-directed RNA polymerase subunit omega [Nitrospiraceae bacterium]